MSSLTPPNTVAISVQALKKLLDAAEQLGLDVVALRAAAGPLTQERVPLAQHHALWEAVERQAPGGDLVPRVVNAGSPRDYGVVGFLCMSAPTVGAALEVLMKHLRVYTDEPVVEVDGGRVRVRYTRPLPERPGLCRSTEATLAEVLTAARALTGDMLVPVAVGFAHAAPADPRALDELFGVPVRWSAGESSMELSAEQMAMPLTSADQQLHELLAPVANQALAKCATEDSLIEKTRRVLGGALSEGAPTVSSVARALAMSERTLRRKLAKEGLGFRALLEKTRQELAREYVANPRVPLAEVSFVLGFSEPSAFHRAFKRWTGQTPATFRRER